MPPLLSKVSHIVPRNPARFLVSYLPLELSADQSFEAPARRQRITRGRSGQRRSYLWPLTRGARPLLRPISVAQLNNAACSAAAKSTLRRSAHREHRKGWTNSPTRCARPSRKKPRSPSRTSCAAAPRRSGRSARTARRRTSWARSARRSCRGSTPASARRKRDSATSSSTSSPRPARARRASSPGPRFQTGVSFTIQKLRRMLCPRYVRCMSRPVAEREQGRVMNAKTALVAAHSFIINTGHGQVLRAQGGHPGGEARRPPRLRHGVDGRGRYSNWWPDDPRLRRRRTRR